MNKAVSPKTFIAVIAACIVIVIGVMVWVYQAPSARIVNPGKAGHQSSRPEDHGPTADDLKKIQEWKKTHPNAFTDNR